MAAKRSIFEEVGSDTKITAAQTGMITQSDQSDRVGISRWLWTLIGMIVVMIIVGGLTRLTDSGLSITTWQLVKGTLPPMGDAAWDAAFAAYKTTQEYLVENPDMTLEGFKVIYWWEWAHRFLGRLIGLVWLVGFLWFWLRGKMPATRRNGLFWIGPLILVQGIVGILMVLSGYEGARTDVASYWLAAHLGLAFVLLGYIYWIAQLVARDDHELLQTRRSRETALFSLSTILLIMVGVQILLGALVAGIDAGRNYTDWPLMAGAILPPDMFALSPWWRNFFEDDGLVQFMHRCWAYLLFAFAIYAGHRAAKSPHKATRRGFAHIGMLLVAQMILGIITVMYSAPWYFAICHQALAILLWLAVLRGRFQAGYPAQQSLREG